MDKRLLLIGGGGHCQSVLDAAKAMDLYDEIGIVDFEDPGIPGVKLVGQDDDLPRLRKSGWTDAIVTVGSVGSTGLRRKLYGLIKDAGFEIATVIDPSAAIAGDTSISEGSFIGKNAVVNTGSKLGFCSIINSGAIVEHDCTVGDFAHLSPGAVLCGQVSVGDDSHVGAGSVVRQLVNIGKNTMIGMGSVVVSDIPDKVTAYGNPCKVVKQ